jgi:hypothetical protein
MKRLPIFVVLWLFCAFECANAGTLTCFCPVKSSNGGGFFGALGAFEKAVAGSVECGFNLTLLSQVPPGTRITCITDTRTYFANSGYNGGSIQQTDAFSTPQPWIVLVPGTQSSVLTQKNGNYSITPFLSSSNTLGCRWAAQPVTYGIPYGIGGSGSTVGGYCSTQAQVVSH